MNTDNTTPSDTYCGPIRFWFNFNEVYWQKVVNEALKNWFDQELGWLFELLDLDADGEDDEVDIDDMTDDIQLGPKEH